MTPLPQHTQYKGDTTTAPTLWGSTTVFMGSTTVYFSEDWTENPAIVASNPLYAKVKYVNNCALYLYDDSTDAKLDLRAWGLTLNPSKYV